MENVVTIGDPGGYLISLTIMGRSHPECVDYWDGNWVSVDVNIRVRSFDGRYGADFRSEELSDFSQGLKTLLAASEGTAVFRTMEQQLELALARDSSGHIDVKGKAKAEPGSGNTLSFSLQIDQTYIPRVIRQIEDVLLRFPVIGKPN